MTPETEASTPPRPTLEEAFGGSDSVQLRYPLWMRGVWCALSIACVGALVMLLDFPQAPAWFHGIHVLAALAWGIATARILLREDRLSSLDVETRSAFGTQRVTWDRVADALIFDAAQGQPTWLQWTGIGAPGLLGAASRSLYDVDANPALAGLPLHGEFLLASTLGLGTGMIVLGVAAALTLTRNRVGFGRCLVLRDEDGNLVFALPSWPCKDADETVLRILAHLDVPVTRVGAGHPL